MTVFPSVCRSWRGPAPTTCCWRLRARCEKKVIGLGGRASEGAPALMRVENRLVGGELFSNRGQFGLGWMVGVSRRGQASELHQAGHEQEPRLRGGEIAPAD